MGSDCSVLEDVVVASVETVDEVVVGAVGLTDSVVTPPVDATDAAVVRVESAMVELDWVVPSVDIVLSVVFVLEEVVLEAVGATDSVVGCEVDPTEVVVATLTGPVPAAEVVAVLVTAACDGGVQVAGYVTVRMSVEPSDVTVYVPVTFPSVAVVVKDDVKYPALYNESISEGLNVVVVSVFEDGGGGNVVVNVVLAKETWRLTYRGR